jgi:hypothetical protein
MFAGKLQVGASVSFIVTVNEHVAFGLIPLVAVQTTDVVPLLKVEPELTVPVVAPEAVQVIVGVGLPVALTVNATAAVHTPGLVFWVMLLGQAVKVGAVPHDVTTKVSVSSRLPTGV